MKNIAIIGASGYTGAQLTLDKGRALADLYPVYSHIDLALSPLTEEAKTKIVAEADAVVLATEHSVSLHLAAWFYNQGLAVFDLSGAYRFSDVAQYPKWYGFEHEYPEVLAKAGF